MLRSDEIAVIAIGVLVLLSFAILELTERAATRRHRREAERQTRWR